MQPNQNPEDPHGAHPHQQQCHGRRDAGHGPHPVGRLRLRLRRRQQIPALSWTNVPAGTKSFAVHCFDPDAPTGSGFWHWVVVNIPASVTELKLDAGNPASGLLPKGALQTRTDFGKPGYGGPCPPEGHGPHRYQFTVFAVKQETLPVNADTSAAIVGFNLHFNTIEKATLTGVFKR